MLSQRKKPTRKSMATMGTLSAFLTMSTKLGSRIDTSRKSRARVPMVRATFGFQNALNRREARKRNAARLMKSQGVVRALIAPFRSSTMGPLPSSQGPGDAAVFPDPPEVDRHQDPRHQRDPHAVEHVEAEERAFAHEPPPEEREARVGARVDHGHVAHPQELRPRPLVAENGSGPGHVRA